MAEPPSEFTIDCDPSTVRYARSSVRAVLSGTPIADDAALIVSELATNATLWSASAAPGGTIRVVVSRPADHIARIEVYDAGPQVPERVDRDAAEDYGRGLKIVGEYSSRMGHETLDDGREVWWAELEWT